MPDKNISYMIIKTHRVIPVSVSTMPEDEEDKKEDIPTEISDIKPKINQRPILDGEQDEDGLFVVPKEYTAEDEIKWGIRKKNAFIQDDYADDTCGFPFTVDPTGAYLCGGKVTKDSPPCNKWVEDTGECVIRKALIDKPNYQSCAKYDRMRASDPEPRLSRHDKEHNTDDVIGFGETKNPLGFGCMRCEYGQTFLPYPTADGFLRWCSLKGMPVRDTACCKKNEPEEEDDK